MASQQPVEAVDQASGDTATALRVITITSGKGGVGKSSLAVNLGITLARRGRRVCIFDADTGLANVNILLGLRPRQGLEQVLAGTCAIEDVLLDGPHGLRVVPGANGIRDCVNLDAARQRRLVSELSRIEQDFDYLLLDTAAGISDTTLDFVGAGHRILLVITPEPTSLTDAFSLLKLALRRHPVVCDVVVNMARSNDEAKSIYHRFRTAVQKYLHAQVQLLGFVPRDESLRSAVALQRPVALFADDDPSRRPFHRLADALERSHEPNADGQTFSRFWFRRFMRPDTATSAAQAAIGSAAADPEDDDATGPASARELARRQDALAESMRLQQDQALVAACLRALHDAAWGQFGEPLLDFESAIRRLQDEPDRYADLLGRLRGLLVPDAGAAAMPPEDDLTDEELALFPDPVVSSSEPMSDVLPDFALPPAAAARIPDPSRSPRRYVVAPRPGRPAFDGARFGDQDALLERLRQLDPADASVAAFIRDLARRETRT